MKKKSYLRVRFQYREIIPIVKLLREFRFELALDGGVDNSSSSANKYCEDCKSVVDFDEFIGNNIAGGVLF